MRLVFDADAGPAVVAALSDLPYRFRLVANVVAVVALPHPHPHPLPRLPVARTVWEPKPDFAASAAAWLPVGPPTLP